MIDLTVVQQPDKEYVETLDVLIYKVAEDNDAGIAAGWYEWDETSPVEKTECSTLTLAHLPNEPYRRWIRDQALKYKSAIRRGTVTQAQLDAIDIRAVALFGLKGWSGFRNAENGEPVDYSAEYGYNALSNDRTFLDFVCDLCRDDALFTVKEDAEAEEETAKN